MNEESLRRATQLFEQVLDLDTEARGRFLTEQCGDDEALRDLVESLLAADERPGNLDTEGLHGEVSDSLLCMENGQRVGAFRIVRALGSGGMGTVYLAERNESDFRQTVAIKVLQRGIDPRRFRIERSILARLQHPNIARLFDGGALQDGRPYVVMEYVEGQAIDAYCDQRKLSIDDRLRLFLQLCEAVQHAHQNLVVHRDLKPGNILVGENGSIKLLDFGIAKLLDDDPGPGLQTRTGARMMTPSFASPEQIRGEAIGTTSDVYSLGVILYQLLTGQRPFQRHENTPREFENTVLGRVASAPSKALAATLKLGDGKQIAVNRAIGDQRLIRRLMGDLDNIVLRALESEPGRRYQSARELAEDITRVQLGFPANARAVGTLYRARKFLARHRFATAAAALVVSVAAVQQFRIVQESELVAKERDVARQERDAAQEITDFTLGLFTAADPVDAKTGTLTARDLLDQGAERIRLDLEDRPHVQIKLMNTIARAYLNLDRFDEAGALLGDAAELARQVYGPDSVDYASVLADQAEYAWRKGEPERAMEQFQLALDIHVRTGSPDQAQLASVRDRIGVLHMDQGQYEQAAAQFTAALDLLDAVHGQGAIESLSTIRNLGGVYYYQDELDAAILQFRKAREIAMAAYGPSNMRLAGVNQALATALQAKGDVEAAEPIYRDAIQTIRAAVGNDNNTTAGILFKLSIIHLEREELDHAEQTIRQSIEILQDVNSTGSWLNGVFHTHLADVLIHRGRWQEAEQHSDEGLRILSTNLGSDHWRTAYSAAVQAAVWAAAGKFERAEHVMLARYRSVREQRNHDVWEARHVRDHLADLYHAWERPEMARLYMGINRSK